MKSLFPFVILIGMGCAAAPSWEPCANETCARCLGSGTYECDACDSTGHVDCTFCRRGEISCRWCFGVGYETGQVKCPTCFGQGWLRCRRCRGQLRAPCRKCGGDGRANCGRRITPPAASAP